MSARSTPAIALCGLALIAGHIGAQPDSGAVRGLPLVEVPARGSGRDLAIMLSGDGGWAKIDRQIAEGLAARGVSVVGFDMRAYLHDERTPDELSRAVAAIARVYGKRWNRERLAIVGYSRGANLAPFAVARFSEDLRARTAVVAMIGLAHEANFKWHWQDVIRDVKRPSDVPVLPEIERLTSVRGMRMLCVFGADEKESACRDVPSIVTRVERPGGHHLDGDYQAIADRIADALAR